MKKIRIFYLKNCQFLVVKFSVYLNRCVFVMDMLKDFFPFDMAGRALVLVPGMRSLKLDKY